MAAVIMDPVRHGAMKERSNKTAATTDGFTYQSTGDDGRGGRSGEAQRDKIEATTRGQQ